MKLLKKSMLVLSVMTLVGGMAFAAAPKNRKKAPARRTVAKKVVAKRPAAESYTCGAERITKAGKVYNLNVAVSGSGARYVSKRGDIEFFKGGKDAIYRGPNNIEKSCTRR